MLSPFVKLTCLIDAGGLQVLMLENFHHSHIEVALP